MRRFPPRGLPSWVGIPPLQRYYQRTTIPCRPSRRTSLPSLGDTMGALGLIRSRRHRMPNGGPGHFYPGSPISGFSSMETTGSPTFLGNLPCASALLFDPGRTGVPSHFFTARRYSPRFDHDEGSHIATFEAQSHSFSARCLRFAERVTPTDLTPSRGTSGNERITRI